MKTKQNNQRFVLISDKVKEWIRVPSSFDIPIYVDKDIVERTIQLVQKRQEKKLFILFFLPLEDMPQVNNFLKGFNQTEISYTIVVFSEDANIPTQSPHFSSILDLRTSKITSAEFLFLVQKAFAALAYKVSETRNREEDMTILDTWNDLEALINIGKSLSLEKDTDKLLRSILYLSKKITGADAGSIYITEDDEEGKKRLRFKYSHTFSKDLSYEEFTLPFDTNSIAGYVAVSGRVLNIPDVYTLNENDPVSFNRSLDQTYGYRTKSMIIVPMRNHIDQIIGLIQLINCKESTDEYSGNKAYEIVLKTPEDFEQKVIPFASRYENLLEAVAGQAAIALENNRMIKQIENQFEEFVKASIRAIESRDPATSGHSFRVAEICVNMARTINRRQNGALAGMFFSETQIKELEFAGLLHDFGKVYINPAVFLKGEKLYPKDFAYLTLRLNFLYRTLELKYAEVLSELYDRAPETLKSKAALLQEEKEEKLSMLREIINLVTEMNKPAVTKEEPEERIQKILSNEKELECTDLEGKRIALLNKDEENNFRIKRGSLNDEERSIIESHVNHTYTFVSKIPWPIEYKQIPDIALKHHEKMDGSGYPNRLKGKKDIPIQARIMTIADIFDALTAADRPYKKTVSLDRAFMILREEASQNKLDSDLVELFINEKAYVVSTHVPKK